MNVSIFIPQKATGLFRRFRASISDGNYIVEGDNGPVTVPVLDVCGQGGAFAALYESDPEKEGRELAGPLQQLT